MTRDVPWQSVVALSGGVGGARLLDGLNAVLPPGVLTAIVNTGDDFVHWGLPVCPDLDTVLYTLAGLADAKRGWGLTGETFACLESMKRYGAEGWFGLGDRDLATHLVRAQRLEAGETLSRVTRALTRALGVHTRILPMSDTPCPTLIETDENETLSLQQWLVMRRAGPRVRAVRFGACPQPAPEVLPALAQAELIVLPPSNPYVSIDPILSLPGVRAAIEDKPVVAVSPIVSGRAIKGPLAEMIPALAGRPASAAAIAAHYGTLVDGFVSHEGDPVVTRHGRATTTDIVMRTRNDRARLARFVLEFGRMLGA